MPSTDSPPDPEVDWPSRIAFGLGSYAEGIKGGAFSYFLLFYYNQALGISGSLAGTALAIALLVDAISDPLVGSISDRHQSRWGRRHPFIYGAAIPFGVMFYLLFVPPDGLSDVGLFAWLLCFAVATRTALTFYSVPHMTLGAELSSNYDERTTLAAVRAFLSIAGSVSVVVVGFAVFFGDDGQLDPGNYPGFALVSAVAMTVTILISGAGTHAHIPRLPKAPTDHVPFHFTRLFRELAQAVGLRPFRFIVSSMIANAAVMGLMATLATYVLTFFWRLEGLQIGAQLSAGMGGGILGSVIASPIAARLGSKRNAKILGMFWFAFFTSILVIARLLHLAPANDSPWLLPLLMGFSLVGGLGLGLVATLGSAMIADVTDEHERVYGTRQEGIYYSAVSFVGKATSGLGTFLAGFAIDLIGLDPNASPETVPQSVIDGLGIAYGPCVLLFVLVPIGLIWGYDIDRERHQGIMQEITARKARAELNPAEDSSEPPRPI